MFHFSSDALVRIGTPVRVEFKSDDEVYDKVYLDETTTPQELLDLFHSHDIVEQPELVQIFEERQNRAKKKREEYEITHNFPERVELVLRASGLEPPYSEEDVKAATKEVNEQILHERKLEKEIQRAKKVRDEL